MRAWVVGGAVIEGPDGVVLVRNRRRGGRHDWSPPGGVIEVETGESLIDGLAREVLEETGLVVTEWEGPIYEIAAEAPGLGWTLSVVAYRAVRFEGELAVDDPDGIVIDARYVAAHECPMHLADNFPWVSEPLLDWLARPWEGRRSYAYRVVGHDITALDVTRM
jgi:8-oxo-dGTP diphosphatase